MRELFDVVLNEADVPLTRDALAAAMQDCDVLVPTVTDRIDADLIADAGERLGLIANFGAGTEHIDLAAAAARRILVTNTPGVFTDDTADIAMAGIIGVPRRIREGTGLVRSGKWTGWAPSGLLGRKLAGKVLGIIGMGRIGQAVAHRARAFGLEIAYYNRKALPEALERMLGARYVGDVDALMAEADILTLHCPLNADTRHLIDDASIATMKPGVMIVTETPPLDPSGAFEGQRRAALRCVNEIDALRGWFAGRKGVARYWSDFVTPSLATEGPTRVRRDLNLG
jgi:glyoxylate reductase